MDLQVDARRKFAKPELPGLAIHGQTDLQVGLQVHSSCKFHTYIVHLQSICVDLHLVAKR